MKSRNEQSRAVQQWKQHLQDLERKMNEGEPFRLLRLLRNDELDVRGKTKK